MNFSPRHALLQLLEWTASKDVMDLSYRKAGKMDTDDFMTRFDPERLGLSELVRGELLEGEEDKKGLRTELYKLNVYG